MVHMNLRMLFDKDAGYDFLCISDHEIYYKTDEFDTDTFICLDGYEMACDNPPNSEIVPYSWLA